MYPLPPASCDMFCAVVIELVVFVQKILKNNQQFILHRKRHSALCNMPSKKKSKAAPKSKPQTELNQFSKALFSKILKAWIQKCGGDVVIDKDCAFALNRIVSQFALHIAEWLSFTVYTLSLHTELATLFVRCEKEIVY